MTTDASANGTGALLFLATGASSTVVPLRVRVGSTDYLVVNASGNVLVSTLTSGRVTYATTSGQLTDSANMTFNGSQIALSVTGSSGGLLLGGDANLYRSGADVLATDDHFNLATTDREIRIATSSNTSGGINFNSGASRISASGTSLRITQTNATGSLAYIGIEGGRSLAPTGTGTNSGSIIGAHFSAAADDSSAGGAVNFSATQTVSGVHAEAYANVLAGASIVASLTGLYANVHFYDDTNLGRLNNLYGVYSYVNATAEAGEPLVDKAYAFYSDMDIPVTENNQERYGLYLKAMPAPGSFTGVVTAAIRMAGTGGARDGLLFASDTNLYRSAADTLKTDDAFVAAAGLTIGTMTSGSVLFSGASGLVSQNNSNLFWDNSNTTLGIGTTRTGSISGTNPSVRIKGTGASSATSAFEVQDSGGNTLLFVRNDGYIGIGLNNPSYHLHFVHTHASDASFTLQNNALTVTSAETGRDIRNLHNTLTIDAGANAISPAGSAFMPNFCNQLIVASGQSGAITVPLYGIHNEVNFIATAGTTHTLVNGVRTLFSMAAGAGSTVTTLDCFLSEVTSGSASSMTVTNLTHYNASYSLSGSPVIGTLTGLNIPNPGAGTVTTQYGIRIRDLSRASTNYAIYLDGTSGLSRQGIWWNADTNLYRSAADTLKTDDAFIAAGGLTVGTLTLGSVVFAGASGALSQDNSNFFWDDTNNFLGVGASASPAARLHLAGNISASTWSTAGIGLRYAGATYTDTASSGTVAAQVVHAFAQPTLAASSSTTYTAAATVYIADAPAAGSNATLTSAYALWVDSGTVRLDGNVLVGTLTSGRVTFAGTGGLLGDSVNMTFNGNRLALATTGNTGGLLIGGDTNLYRSAADVLATDDHVALTTTDRELRLTTTNENTGGIVWNTSYRLSTNAQSGFYFTVPDSADTGGGVYGVRMARRLAPTADSGTTLYGFDSSATVSDVSASGPLNFTDSGTGFSALSLYETFQTGGTLATQYGLRATASFYDDNGGTGGVLAAQVGAYILTDDSGGSGSVVTGSRVLLVEQASPYTANGQTRYGLYVVAMPDPGSFTGTTTAAIRLAGTGGARDGVLFGSDTNIYRSASNTLKTDDALVVAAGLTVLALGASVTGAISGTTSLTLGANGGTGGTVVLNGATSGAVTMTVQASAGTYNFNLPTTAGSSGYLLTSAGGVASPMTWTDPGALAVRWNSLTNPSGNLSLTMSTNLTTFNWATGTSSNNLFSLTTDASANGTGALLNIQTGASAAVLPLRVRAGSVEAIYVNASGQVSIGTSTASATLTVRKSSSGTVFAVRDTGDSASTFTIDDTGLASASNVSILNAGKLSMYESGSGNYSSLAAGTQSADIRYTLPTTQPSTNQVLKAASVSGSGPYDVTTSWSTPSGGVDWTDVTGTSQTAAAGNGYLANNASLVTFTLPTPAVGSIVEIVGVGAGGWLANCASGHTVRMGNVVSASTGSVASTNRYDSIKLLGVSATAWQIIHAVGTVDIV
ncbi:MAG: hypothetical protein JSS66_04645 [Armatimonadetes bacterium]|nr:hypothetical protein [Armatimonadota bacterium]